MGNKFGKLSLPKSWPSFEAIAPFVNRIFVCKMVPAISKFKTIEIKM